LVRRDAELVAGALDDNARGVLGDVAEGVEEALGGLALGRVAHGPCLDQVELELSVRGGGELEVERADLAPAAIDFLRSRSITALVSRSPHRSCAKT
jgi:hypothetical protein